MGGQIPLPRLTPTYVLVCGLSILLGSQARARDTLNSLLSSGKSPLLVGAVGVAVGLTLFAFRYPASSVPVTIATILLFCTVFAYVLSSLENIKLLREQFARQELVCLDFGLQLDDAGALSIWAANLGTSSFLLSELEVRTQERPNPQHLQINVVVPAGTLSHIPFDDRIFHNLRADAFVHFDVSLKYRGLAENHQTRWKGFTVERRPHRQLEEGFTGLWGVACPKCSRFDFMGMNTEELPDLDAAWRRQAELEIHLEASCPHHHSALLLEPASTRQLVGVS